MVQFSASPVRMANSTALRLMTGKTPGMPRHTGHVWVLGAAPNFVPHPQNILDSVRSCACTSSPMTTSYATGYALALLFHRLAAGLERRRQDRLLLIDELLALLEGRIECLLGLFGFCAHFLLRLFGIPLQQTAGLLSRLRGQQ